MSIAKRHINDGTKRFDYVASKQRHMMRLGIPVAKRSAACPQHLLEQGTSKPDAALKPQTRAHTAVYNDSRELFLFDVLDVRTAADGQKYMVYSGASVTLYAANKREAIKLFVAMFTPTTRFKVTNKSNAEDNE